MVDEETKSVELCSPGQVSLTAQMLDEWHISIMPRVSAQLNRLLRQNKRSRCQVFLATKYDNLMMEMPAVCVLLENSSHFLRERVRRALKRLFMDDNLMDWQFLVLEGADIQRSGGINFQTESTTRGP